MTHNQAATAEGAGLAGRLKIRQEPNPPSRPGPGIEKRVRAGAQVSEVCRLFLVAPLEIVEPPDQIRWRRLGCLPGGVISTH